VKEKIFEVELRAENQEPVKYIQIKINTLNQEEGPAKILI